MTNSLNRRSFLGASAAAGSALGFFASSSRAVDRVSANDTITVAVLGVNNQGQFHAENFAQQKGAEVAVICDVDQRVIAKGVAAASQFQKRTPSTVEDLRRVLDDPTIDAVSIAMPNHWHAPATILACAAGKHVYVEKPCSYNPEEGELSIAASRKYDRVVQMGSQRRTYLHYIDAVHKLRGGEIGEVHLARAWYNNRRPSIGRGKRVAVPDELNYDLWQGPAPEQPYKDNLIHYNWHWHWHWGNGELGNNGIHLIDVARWGLGVDYPTQVSSAGSRLRYQEDDQETPDTHFVTFQFDNKMITWEGLSHFPYGPGGSRLGLTFHGDEGTMHLVDDGYTIYDLQNKKVSFHQGERNDPLHYANFLEAIRSGTKPAADIEEGHKSTLLCHLGNIAHRVGRSLETDPQNGHILGDAEANALCKRKYRTAWKPDGATA